MAKQKREPVIIKPMSFGEVLKEAAEKHRKSEEDFAKTGLCQHNVEISDGVWEPCKNLADPKYYPNRICESCQKEFERLMKELADSQGPGDFFTSI